jgi:hypothetical protein
VPTCAKPSKKSSPTEGYLVAEGSGIS